MTLGFHNKRLMVQTEDGLDDTLLDALVYRSVTGIWYRAPVGSTTDGLSTPKIVRLIPGYDATGDDWWSGVLHDSAYRGFLEIKGVDGIWRRAWLSQAQADALILEAMRSQGVGFARRQTIYLALRAFGSMAFKADRTAAAAQQRIEPIANPSHN